MLQKSRWAPWTIELWRLLESGPQPWPGVLDILAPFVPPGKALRKYNARNNKGTGRRSLTIDAKIWSGARQIVDGSVHASAQRDMMHVVRDELGMQWLELTLKGRLLLQVSHQLEEGMNANQED